ncbi:CocE/NonD family hydrolase [Mesorhizobium intechi]|uniref:CocE/NonD family hydrolase n=1 Tax=Mesorhizobium intechi TaxID=537601 RepID=UPI000CAE87BD|nr:CocE/NonD family hydrolase [Mesorhizobium intechi]TSE12789.1 CocE/NonD family hydrolase [Mesorhizobium intechi]
MTLDVPHTKTDTVARDIGYVTMQDGMRVAYICYRRKSGRHPTVFLYSPYDASATPFEVAKPFLDAGYAFVGANFPATGCSEGVLETWFDRKEGIYGAEVVEWIAKQPWSNGDVGMVGNSSAASVQMWVAAEQPPHLRAIVASGMFDAYEWIYQGGMLQLYCLKWAFTSQFIAQASGVSDRIKAGDTECSAICGSDRQVVKNSFYDEIRRHPLNDEWWDSIYLACKEVAGKIRVPTMLIGAWQDRYAVRESARIFSQLMPNVEHKKLVLMNGDHGGTGALGPQAPRLVDEERMKFLDRWVKGVKNGIEDEPAVTVYWEAWEPEGDPKKQVAGWATHHKAWPEPTVERRPYYLTADARISADRPGASPNEGSRAYLYPTGAELYGTNEQFAAKPYQEGVLNYRTEVAASDVTLLGSPQVTLYLSIDEGDDTDLELTLKDVDADGNALFLQADQLRASLRAIDEQRTSSDEIVHLFRKSEKLEPGNIYDIRMSISPIGHVIRKGHCLELTIGAPSPIIKQAIGSFPIGVASINSVYHSEKYPSKIVLPIIPEAKAQAPAPEWGTQRAQPCRKGTEFEPGGLPTG